MTHIPELISPGGSYTKALVAARNGAEAVYLGVPFTSLRMRQNKVRDYKILQQTIDELHQLGTKAYLTMNIFPRNIDIKVFESVVEKISDMGADAVIFSDPGTFKLIRKYLPDVRLHLSTQANMLNHEAIAFWHDLGVSRVVLARELTIKEITQIKTKVPDVELEVFVHGAMCIAYSGRCLMGEYFSGRDGNKGECSHVCRYNFKMYLEEPRRPGKLMELGQDENGTFMMSSKDLCTIERLEELIPVVDGLKIEGRSKSEMYVGAISKAYRHVRDAIINGTEIDISTKDLVYQVPHRQYRDGFLFNDIRSAPDGEEPIVEDDVTYNEHGGAGDDITNQGVSRTSPGPIAEVEYVGLVLEETTEIDGKIFHKFIPKQKIAVGDTLQYFDENGLGDFKIAALSIKGVDADDQSIHVNHGDVWIRTDIDLKGREILYRPATDPKSEGDTRGVTHKCSC